MSRLDACIIVCPVGARCTRLARCALSYFWFASFYVAKGYKLQAKRTPFAAWNVPFCNALIVRRLCGECECLLASAFCRQFLCPLPCAGHAAGILLFVVVLGCFAVWWLSLFLRACVLVGFADFMSSSGILVSVPYVRVHCCFLWGALSVMCGESCIELDYWCILGKKCLFRNEIWEKMKKVREKFGGKKKTPYLCTRLQEQGRLAQLV